MHISPSRSTFHLLESDLLQKKYATQLPKTAQRLTAKKSPQTGLMTSVHSNDDFNSDCEDVLWR